MFFVAHAPQTFRVQIYVAQLQAGIGQDKSRRFIARQPYVREGILSYFWGYCMQRFHFSQLVWVEALESPHVG